MKKIIFGISLILSFAYLNAQKQVMQLADSNDIIPNNYSFYYTLNKTVLHFDITVIKTKEIKGNYSDFAEKLLGLSNIIENNRATYKLSKVSLSTVEIPDQQQIYAVELSSHQLKNDYLTYIYNQEKENLVTSPKNDYSPHYSSIPDFFKYYSDLVYTETDDSFVETRIINGVVTQVPVNQTKIVSKSKEQQAQVAADYIMKIRKDRYELMTGTQEVPYTKEAIEYMVNSLNQTEQNYLALFTGFTVEEELHYTLDIIPNGFETKIPLFAISPEEGFIYGISSEENYNYILSLAPHITHEKWSIVMSEKNHNEKSKPNKGYRIRNGIPVSLSLTQNNIMKYHFGNFTISQYGKIETLPANQDNFDISGFGFIY